MIRKSFLKIVAIVLALLAAVPAWAQHTDEAVQKVLDDSAASFIYKNGVLELLNPQDDNRLVCYAQGPNADGFKAIYYLFTSRPYLNLRQVDSVGNKNIYAIFESQGKWKNIKTNQGAAGDRKFPMNSNEEIRFRCVEWDQQHCKLLIATNAQLHQDSTQTILLIARPPLEKPGLTVCLIHHADTFSFEDFKKKYDTLDPKNGKQTLDLSEYQLLVRRTRGLVVDSIFIGGKKVAIGKDTPLQSGEWAIPLSSYEVNPNGGVWIATYCREFKDGKFVPAEETDTRCIEPYWKKDPEAAALKIIVIVFVGIALFLFLFIFLPKLRDRKAKKVSEAENTPPETCNGGKETNDTKSVREVMSLFLSKLRLRKAKKNPEAEKAFPESGNGGNETGDTRPDIEVMEDGGSEEGTTVQPSVETPQDPAQKWEEEKENLQEQIKKLKSEAKSENTRATDAERQLFDKTRELEEEKKARGEAERNVNGKVQEAERRVREECRGKLQKAEEEKKAAVGSILTLAKNLKDLLESIRSEAGKGAGDSIKNGVSAYCDKLQSIAGDNDLALSETIAAMQTFSCELLNLTSGCWMHRLGRLYSYLSVETLRNIMEGDGLSVEVVESAYRMLSALLAAQNIVIASCSCGIDSNQTPAIRHLFELDTTVNQINAWLGSSEAIMQAVADHGSTVYDFGRLAYYTTDNPDNVHKGSIIYFS